MDLLAHSCFPKFSNPNPTLLTLGASFSHPAPQAYQRPRAAAVGPAATITTKTQLRSSVIVGVNDALSAFSSCVCRRNSFLFISMTKKSSKTTPNQLQENTVAKEEKPSSTPKKACNEIDEIFAGKKRKKSEMKNTGKSDGVNKSTDKTKEKKKKKKNVKRKTDGSDDGEFADRPSGPKRKTEDGFTIYTEDELGINKADAGNTPLCPFDCSCCF